MSRLLINAYRTELDHLKAVSGSKRESVLREAFKDLLKRWGKSNDLLFIPEHNLITPKGNRIYVDGALLHGLRVPFPVAAWHYRLGNRSAIDWVLDQHKEKTPRDPTIRASSTPIAFRTIRRP